MLLPMLLLTLGCGALIAGATLIYLPAGFLLGGLLLCLLALYIDPDHVRGRRR